MSSGEGRGQPSCPEDSGKNSHLKREIWADTSCSVYDPRGDGVRLPHGKPDRVTIHSVPDDSYPTGSLMVRR